MMENKKSFQQISFLVSDLNNSLPPYIANTLLMHFQRPNLGAALFLPTHCLRHVCVVPCHPDGGRCHHTSPTRCPHSVRPGCCPVVAHALPTPCPCVALLSCWWMLLPHTANVLPTRYLGCCHVISHTFSVPFPCVFMPP